MTNYGKKMNPLGKILTKNTYEVYKKFNEERYGKAYDDKSSDNSLDMEIKKENEAAPTKNISKSYRSKANEFSSRILKTEGNAKVETEEENPVKELQDKLYKLASKKNSLLAPSVKNAILRRKPLAIRN
mmetsp:Transcript_30718/g.27917  ORF Transcript_30718/g.27917 Transcript_30718/m.27917 type:complete len:129 (+) Transcript_30718:961-1347(+)